MESDPTFRALMARYLAEETPLKAASTQRHDHFYARLLLTAWDGVDAAEISPRHVVTLHREISSTRGPVLANRVVSLVSQLCLLAERDRLRPAQSNPTLAVKLYSEPRRTVFLREEQRGPFVDAVRKCVAFGEVAYSPGLLSILMMLTGLRWSSARGLEWAEVDLRAGVIRLRPRAEDRENKAGDECVVPITDDVVEILSTTPRFCALVAPNRRTLKPYTSIRKALRRICDRAGVLVTPHMLRHTFGTALAESGLTQSEIGACMGHRSDSTAWRYIHLAAKPARRALLKAADALKGRAS